MTKRTDPEILKLVEIAKNPLPEDETVKLPPVKRFMVSDGVELGTEKIRATLIYDRYVKWCAKVKIVELSSVEFFKELALYTTKKVTGKGTFYHLSPKGFNMTPEYLALVNQNRMSGGKKKKVSI